MYIYISVWACVSLIYDISNMIPVRYTTIAMNIDMGEFDLSQTRPPVYLMTSKSYAWQLKMNRMMSTLLDISLNILAYGPFGPIYLAGCTHLLLTRAIYQNNVMIVALSVSI